MAKKRTVKRRKKTAPKSIGLAAPETRDVDDADLASLVREVEGDGGAVLALVSRAVWRDAGAARRAAGRPGRAHALPARSVAAARQASDARHRDARPVSRSDHRHPARTTTTGRRTAIIGCRRCARSARARSSRCWCRIREIAFKILALNTEKAHNLKEKSLETIRMLRALADAGEHRDERAFAFEFDQPSFLTLGAAYEERPRLSGGAYQSVLRRIDDFLDEPPAASALKERIRRAAKAPRDRRSRRRHRREAQGPRLHQPLPPAVRRRAHQPDPVLDLDGVRLRRGDGPDEQAAEKFKVEKIRQEDVVRAGGGPAEADEGED